MGTSGGHDPCRSGISNWDVAVEGSRVDMERERKGEKAEIDTPIELRAEADAGSYQGLRLRHRRCQPMWES
jgi:hypothetical protein